MTGPCLTPCMVCNGMHSHRCEPPKVRHQSDSGCQCGHPWDQHELVKGFECGPHVTIDGQTSVPDVWVCSGGRLVDIADPDLSPWDFVCGCVLHDAPPLRSVA